MIEFVLDVELNSEFWIRKGRFRFKEMSFGTWIYDEYKHSESEILNPSVLEAPSTITPPQFSKVHCFMLE
jgi:hypothetical protein